MELPARFMWRTFRQALGREAVPPVSPFDKTALTWRLMAPAAGAARTRRVRTARTVPGGDDVVRRLQLCRRLADLYDQYQVYRSDWLDAWAHGRDVLPNDRGARYDRCRRTRRGSPRCGANCSAP